MCFQMVMRIGEFVLDLIAVTRMSDDEKEREILLLDSRCGSWNDTFATPVARPRSTRFPWIVI
jgi:hypothetical protein